MKTKTSAVNRWERIIFLSSSDPLDVRSFSGTLYYMADALRVEIPGLEIIRHSRPFWFRRLKKVARWARTPADPYFWRTLNRIFAARLALRWAGKRVLVISVVNSTLAAELSRHVRVVHISDATFRLLHNLYDSHASMSETATAKAEAAEREAIRNAVHNSFSSPWAARSAVEDYGADPSRVSFISWGCNLPFIEGPAHPWDGGGGPCRLLFVGRDWHRKGGDIVLATAQILQERGFPFVLDLVGSAPGEGLPDIAGVVAHGLLRKDDPEQMARLVALNRQAAFLFLPTRQDCTPMVFAEANAYGTPALTRDVGGVGGVVKDGVNGFLLPSGATPEDFADRIIAAWSDQARYQELRSSARAEYQQRLNWPVWAKTMAGLVRDLGCSDHLTI